MSTRLYERCRRMFGESMFTLFIEINEFLSSTICIKGQNGILESPTGRQIFVLHTDENLSLKQELARLFPYCVLHLHGLNNIKSIILIPTVRTRCLAMNLFID